MAAKKFGFAKAATDCSIAIDDPAVDAIAIATRHDTHADLVCKALAAGKHVFVEKPLCITLDELDTIQHTYDELTAEKPILMVGFNRRFAPHTLKIKELLNGAVGPKSMVMSVNAGPLPLTHWHYDRRHGGGRLMAEACHFIDYLRFLIASPIIEQRTNRMKSSSGDTATIELSFADGSIGTIHYFGNGNRKFPKERLEVFAEGRILQLENFRKLTGYGWPRFKSQSLWRQDKGHNQCAAAFLKSIHEAGPAPIPFDEICEVTASAIRAATDDFS